MKKQVLETILFDAQMRLCHKAKELRAQGAGSLTVENLDDLEIRLAQIPYPGGPGITLAVLDAIADELADISLSFTVLDLAVTR